MNKTHHITPAERGKPLILVLCTGNSCRSQMAEAFLRKHHGDRFAVRSGGTQPAERVHPLAIRAMTEVGIDMGEAVPKSSHDFLGHLPVDHLVLVCDRASLTCPSAWPGVQSRHDLPFVDPADAEGSEAEVMAVFRRVRDEIDRAMRGFDPRKPAGEAGAAPAEATR